MAEVIDYMHDEAGDLIFEKGDFKKGDATQQHGKVLLLATKGSFTQSPTTGVSVVDYLLDDVDDDELRHVIQEEYEADGRTIRNIDISAGELTIDSDYGD